MIYRHHRSLIQAPANDRYPSWPVIALTLLFVPTVTLAAGQGPCLVANSMRDAGFFDEAVTAYTEVLGDEDIELADKQCAVDQLPRVLQRQVRSKVKLAIFYRIRGDEEAAVETLKEALELNPRSAAVMAALVSLGEPEEEEGDDPIARAMALASFGLHDEALEVLTDWLKKEHENFEGPINIPNDLQYLSGGKFQKWRDFRRSLRMWMPPVLEMLASFFLLIAFFYLLYRWKIAKPKVQITEFDVGGFEEEHFGRYFSHSLNNRVEDLKAGSRHGDVELVTGPIEAIELPSEVEAIVPDASATWMSPVAWAKAIPALINWIFPRRLIQITGSLHSSGNRGVGVTVRMVEKNRILTAYAFWQNDFDDTEDPSLHDTEDSLFQLAEYVAVWVLFETQARIGDKPLTLLGTDNWRSYSQFRAALFAEDDARDAAARTMYIRALRRDEKFRGARLNLGLWLIRNKRLEIAQEQLNQVVQESRRTIGSDREPTIYSAMYNLAVLESESGDNVAAISDLNDLIVTINATLKKIENKDKGYTNPALVPYLNEIRPAAYVMLGTLMVFSGNENGRLLIEQETSTTSLSVRQHYNMACAYSMLAAHERIAQKMPGATNTGAEKIKDDLNVSLNHLKRAFQLSDRATLQAKIDPSLDEVRTKMNTAFEGLLEEYMMASRPEIEEGQDQPLADLILIGDTHAEALAAIGIFTPDDLLKRASSRKDRKTLADELTESPRVVTQWAHAADLTRIGGLGIPQANLLLLAQVTRITELGQRDPQLLTDDLHALSQARDEDDSPDLTAVGRWILQATTSTLPSVV